MEHRQLGTSDLTISAITLGTWAVGGWMWGGTEDREALAAIAKALDAGVTSIDTAPAYGFGHAEELVGQAIRGRRGQLQVLTKFGLRWDTEEGEHFFDTQDSAGRKRSIVRNARPESVVWECEQSLRRLGVDHIDLFQCHWRDHTTPVADTMGAVARLIEQGKVRAAGVSNFTVEEIAEARKVVPLASDQPPYSMIKRDIEDDVLPYCREHGVGVICYSPLQLGILSGKVTMDTSYPDDDLRSSSPWYQPANRRQILDFLERIRPIAEAHDATLAQLVIRWTIQQPGITAALVGARKERHAEENAAAADFELSSDELGTIRSELEKLSLDPDA